MKFQLKNKLIYKLFNKGVPFFGHPVETVVADNDVASNVDTNDVAMELVGPRHESLNRTVKRSRLESVFSKITRNIDHSSTL